MVRIVGMVVVMTVVVTVPDDDVGDGGDSGDGSHPSLSLTHTATAADSLAGCWKYLSPNHKSIPSFQAWEIPLLMKGMGREADLPVLSREIHWSFYRCQGVWEQTWPWPCTRDGRKDESSLNCFLEQ